MRAFVMAAGKGTRLAPLTDVLPKPVIPVANEPVMGHLLRLLARQGIRQVVSNISYMADRMRATFGDGTAYGVDLAWSHEQQLLGTAGGFKRAEDRLRDGDEPVIVLSGDGLHDADLLALVRAHRDNSAMATIALKQVADPAEYGVAILDGARITSFQEKPALGTELSDLANTGIYIFEPAIFDLLPDGFYDWGNDLFPRMLEEGLPLYGVPLPGYWNDIGGLEAYRDSNLAVADGRVGLRDTEVDASGRFSDDVLVHPSAKIGSDVTIAGPSVIGPNVTIGDSARISRSVILPGASVPPGALVITGTFGDAHGLDAWAQSLDQPGIAAGL